MYCPPCPLFSPSTVYPTPLHCVHPIQLVHCPLCPVSSVHPVRPGYLSTRDRSVLSSCPSNLSTLSTVRSVHSVTGSCVWTSGVAPGLPCYRAPCGLRGRLRGLPCYRAPCVDSGGGSGTPRLRRVSTGNEVVLGGRGWGSGPDTTVSPAEGCGGGTSSLWGPGVDAVGETWSVTSVGSGTDSPTSTLRGL